MWVLLQFWHENYRRAKNMGPFAGRSRSIFRLRAKQSAPTRWTAPPCAWPGSGLRYRALGVWVQLAVPCRHPVQRRSDIERGADAAHSARHLPMNERHSYRDVGIAWRDVRFVPASRHHQRGRLCPKSANFGSRPESYIQSLRRRDVRTGWATTLRNDNILLTKLLLDCLHAVGPQLSMLFDQPRCESRPITTLQRNYGDRDAVKRIVRERAQSFMNHPYQISAGNSFLCHPNASKKQNTNMDVRARVERVAE
jgi:hypothetical protein